MDFSSKNYLPYVMIARTIIGMTVGGLVGGPLGAVAGAVIANDTAGGEFQHDE